MAKVIKLAQPGYDVKTAGDQNLIYSSNWPLLKIHMQGSATITDFSQKTQLIVKHDLGYAPLFWYFTNNQISNWAAMPFVGDQRSEFQGVAGGSNGEQIGVNSTELRYCSVDVDVGGSTTTTGPLKIYYYIFAINLETAYTAPAINVGDQPQSIGGTKVFKIAKRGSDISSDKLEDYIIHSAARSPMIHSVNPLVSTPDSTITEGYSATVYHKLGYIPMFFGFRLGLISGPITHFPDTYFPLYTASSASGTSLVPDNSKIQLRTFFNNRKVSVIILKDPFNIDYRVDIRI